MLISCLTMYRKIFSTYLRSSSRFSGRLQPVCQRTSWNCQLWTRSGSDESKSRSAAFTVGQNKVDVVRAVESLSEKIKDSLDLLEDAKSSLGTVYFSDDMNDAEQSVEETLLDFQLLLDQIDTEQRVPVGRSMAPEMQELKMQLHLLKENAKTLKMKKH